MRLLFVCTGNVFRSVSAKFCLEQYLKEHNITDVEVDSAGTKAYPEPINDTVKATLASYGIDVSTHVQKKLTREIAQKADLIVAMADYHQAFIKKQFNMSSVLFNMIANNSNTSVLDIDDVIDNLEDTKACDLHIIKTIHHIHNSIPSFARNMHNFV